MIPGFLQHSATFHGIPQGRHHNQRRRMTKTPSVALDNCKLPIIHKVTHTHRKREREGERLTGTQRNVSLCHTDDEEEQHLTFIVMEYIIQYHKTLVLFVFLLNSEFCHFFKPAPSPLGFLAALRNHMISLVCNYLMCGPVVKALEAFSKTITGEV